MIRIFILAALTILTGTLRAQTIVRITNVTITEKEAVSPGKDLTSVLDHSTGSERVVLFTDGPYAIQTWFKVTSYNSPRSSVKDGAVNLTMELDLLQNGRKKDNRRVEKIFYADQVRSTSFNETFVIKEGIDARSIKVTFDASVE